MTAAAPAPGAATRRWYRPAGSGADPPWELSISPQSAGWSSAGLRVLALPPGGAAEFRTGADEAILLPLAGSCELSCDGRDLALSGRPGVFAGPSDFAYLPRDATAAVRSAAGGRFALLTARAGRRLPVRYGPAAAVPVELRGAGPCSRAVRNFATPEAFDADNLIGCEVITPAGNWSSYPPHKHDEATDTESALEEIYYFEVAPGPGGRPGIGYQRVYGAPGRPIDVLAEVRSGDVVLVPFGWHGPSMAVPGYDLYYLNVMAGPGPGRAWRIRDDPAHGWVRGTWADQPVDPRLTGAGAAGPAGPAAASEGGRR